MRPALEEYLGGVDPAAAPLIVALDQAVRKAHPGFDVAIKYRILMYALDGDWRTWVIAISPARKGVGLRFLYGVLLDDPRHVLRAGSSVLKTWDFAIGDSADAAVVRVRQGGGGEVRKLQGELGEGPRGEPGSRSQSYFETPLSLTLSPSGERGRQLTAATPGAAIRMLRSPVRGVRPG